MTQQVNELGVLGIASVPALGAPVSYDISMAPPAEDSSMNQAAAQDVPSPPPVTSVYVVSAEVVNGYSEDPDVIIDLVLNVSTSHPDSYRTYKVLKRLTLNRDKLAAEAVHCETVRVEEKLDTLQQDLKRLRDFINR